jgi:hypothetical protein
MSEGESTIRTSDTSSKPVLDDLVLRSGFHPFIEDLWVIKDFDQDVLKSAIAMLDNAAQASAGSRLDRYDDDIGAIARGVFRRPAVAPSCWGRCGCATRDERDRDCPESVGTHSTALSFRTNRFVY